MVKKSEPARTAETSRASVTIRDVARASGVSIATVTRTFQESPTVRQETRERVVRAAEQLGYRPDPVARALVTGSTKTVGVLVPSIRTPYWSEVTHGIEQLAGTHGFSVVVATSRGEPDRERKMLEVLFSKRLDGIIVGGAAGNAASWPLPDQRTPPLVLLEWDETPRWDLLEQFSTGRITKRAVRAMSDQDVAGPWVAHAVYDDVRGGELVAEHLLELGHRDVAFVSGPPVRTSLLRLLGFRGKFQEAGLDARVVTATDDSFDAAYEAAIPVLQQDSHPTALACYNDVLAIGVMKAARDVGLNVPRDVSVVGYDDIEFAQYVDPPLTTLCNPKRELGELALELVLAARTNETRGQRHKLAGTLILRASTDVPADQR